MPSAPTRPASAVATVRSGRLPDSVALVLLASIILSFLAGSSVPTPIYPLYQAEWHFSPITTTIVFGIYALAVLAALLTVGALSDYVGRRPVLLAALAVQAVVMLVFATAGGVPQLLLARILQGLATGAAAGAIGAGMLDLHRVRGTIANAVAPLLGTGSGALGSGLLVQYLPAPTHLGYLVLFGVFLVQALGVLFIPETSARRPGAVASLRPRLALPAATRHPFLVAVPVLVAVWSLAGLYGALGPALVRLLVGANSYALAGLALFVVAGSGAVSVLFLRAAAARVVLILGTVGLLVGVAITLLAISSGTVAVFFFGSAVAGVGFGAGFQGALRTVLPLADPRERAGVLSLLYTVSYLALGLPTVVAGFLVVHGGGVLQTAQEYGVAVMALAGLALVVEVRPGRPHTPPLPVTSPAPGMVTPEARQLCSA